MSVERTFYCDAPDCETHVRTMADFPSAGYIRTYQRWPGFDEEKHFCSWDCVIKHGATIPPIVEVTRLEDV